LKAMIKKDKQKREKTGKKFGRWTQAKSNKGGVRSNLVFIISDVSKDFADMILKKKN